MDQRFVQSGSHTWYEEDSVEQTESIKDADIPLLLDEIRHRYDISELDSEPPNDPHTWDEEDSVEQTESIKDADIPLLLDEIHHRYDISELDSEPPNDPHISNDASPIELLDEAIIKSSEPVDKGCAYCSKQERVEDVATFAKGQHLSMPSLHLTKYNGLRQKFEHVYKNHAIVSKVINTSGTIAELELIHYTSDEDNTIQIRRNTQKYDLRQKEIYHVRYLHPRYQPDEIVSRAESMLPEHRSEGQEHRPEGPEHRQEGPDFKTYKLASSNCEHFATWCVVGEKESLQVQTVIDNIIKGLKWCFSDSSIITRGITKLLVKSVDDLSVLGIPAAILPKGIFGVSCLVYLVYCIVQTMKLREKHKKGRLCLACQKAKLIDLWGPFITFSVPSLATSLISLFALPLLGSGIGIPLVVVLSLLSVALQWSISKIRRWLKSPFHVDRNKIESLSALDIGDIISFPYYKLEHVAVVTEYDETTHQVKCIHYALPSLPGKRIVKEETFTIDPSKQTVKLFDCSPFKCRPKHRVIEMARKRVGETKWSTLHRSDHLCFWAKVQTAQRRSSMDVEAIQTSSKERPTSFIREMSVHVMTDLLLGDVVKYDSKRGILVRLESLDNNYGRRFRIEMIVYGRGWRVCRRTFTIDLDIHHLTVEHYHPATCYPMSTRVERVLALEGKVGEWWLTDSFIKHCISLSRSDTCIGS